MKRFLGSCQQNRHLRHTEREREKERGDHLQVLRIWKQEALTASSVDPLTVKPYCAFWKQASRGQGSAVLHTGPQPRERPESLSTRHPRRTPSSEDSRAQLRSPSPPDPAPGTPWSTLRST